MRSCTARFALACALAVACSHEGDDPPAAAVAELPPPPSETPASAETLPPVTDAAPSDGATEVEAPAPEPEPEPDPLHGAIASGDSLSKVLHRAGVPSSVAARVVTAITPHVDPTTIQVGQRYDIRLDEGGELVAFTFHPNVTTIVTVVAEAGEGEAATWKATTEEVPTVVVEQEIAGTVESSLWAAMADAGNAAALVDLVVDVFAYDIDFFTATREGDTFRLVIERHELDGEHVRYGRVLAAQYDGEAAQAFVVWWPGHGGTEGRYVDDEGRGVARTLLKTPLKYSRISSGFSPARMHPVLHRVKSHRGVDYAAPEGTPVWAAADGTISFRGPKGGAGNLVVIRHAGGLSTQYMHLSKFRSGQKVGDRVEARTVIGYVGSTGLATGPHLHFGVLQNGTHVDPTKIESVRQPGIAAGDRGTFERFRDDWRARLDGLEVAGGSAAAADTAEAATEEDAVETGGDAVAPRAVNPPTTAGN